MKNTNTTLRELSHKYASVLRKCAILNAMVLMSVAVAMPVRADIHTENITIGENKTRDLGDIYEEKDGIEVDSLTMSSGARLEFTQGYNNTSIKNGTFTGTVDFSTPNTGTNNANTDSEEDFNGPSRRINVNNATLNNVDFIGHFNEQNYDEDDAGKPIPASRSNWENYNGLQADALTLSGRVTMKDIDVSMYTEDKEQEEYEERWFNAADKVFSETSTYEEGTDVIYGVALYEVNSSKSFQQQMYEDLGSSDVVERIDYMSEYGDATIQAKETYNAGERILVYDTVANLKEAGLLTEGDDGYDQSDETLIRLAYQVKAGETYTALAVEDTLTLVERPKEHDTSITVQEGSVVKLNSSNLAGEGCFDEESRAQYLNALHEAMSQGASEEELKEIEDGYEEIGYKTENLPIDVLGSTVEIGNGSRIGKETSGKVNITTSKLDIWGTTKDEEGNDYDDPMDGFSSIDHFGYTGNVSITGSTINLYPNSGILRSTATDDPEGWFSDTVENGSEGNILLDGSIINMYGSTREGTFTTLIDEEEKTSIDAPVVILAEAANGNMKLDNQSKLNVYGDDNKIYIRNSNTSWTELIDDEGHKKIERDTTTEDLKKNALHVLDSSINIATDAELSLYHYDDGDKLGGTIALDQGGVIDLKGTLDADIVGLTPSVNITKETVDGKITHNIKLADNFGRVYLYNGARLNGIIDGVNVHIMEDTALKGDGLTIQGGAVLDLGTNLLTTTALSSNASLIEATISSEDEYGALNVNNLTFDNSLVRINVDMDLKEGESVKIPFLTGDTTKLSTEDFYNTKYDFEYNNGVLTLTRNGNSGMISVDELNKAMSAADAWSNPDSFASGSPAQIIAMRLNNLKSSPEFEKIVKKLQPTDAHQGHQVANQTNQQVVGAANGRMGGSGHYGNNGHTNNGHHNGTGGQNTNGNHYGTQAGRSGGDTFNNVGMWVQGLYNHAKLSGSNGYTGKSKGVAMGMDGMMTDNLKLGFGYAYSTTDVDADGSNTDVNTHTGMLYGEYMLGNAFVNAAGTYGYSTYEGKRDLLGTSIKSDYNTDSLYGQLMTGYNFDLTNISLTPETGLRYLWTKTHSYTENPIDQHVSSSKNSTLTGVIGGRMGMLLATEKATIMPELKLAATYDLKRDNEGASVRLANGASYVVEGEALKRFGIETGAKVGMTIDNMDFSLSYEGRFKKDYQDHTGMINFRYNF